MDGTGFRQCRFLYLIYSCSTRGLQATIRQISSRISMDRLEKSLNDACDDDSSSRSERWICCWAIFHFRRLERKVSKSPGLYSGDDCLRRRRSPRAAADVFADLIRLVFPVDLCPLFCRGETRIGIAVGAILCRFNMRGLGVFDAICYICYCTKRALSSNAESRDI
jgi:hypothetical protein